MNLKRKKKKKERIFDVVIFFLHFLEIVNLVFQRGHPMASSSEDDDADFKDIPFPQDTAMQQVCTVFCIFMA
jgi:hypothetical protein